MVSKTILVSLAAVISIQTSIAQANPPPNAAQDAMTDREGDELALRVRQAVLDQLNPVRVNVSTKGITTLQFPMNIEAIDGDGFATSPEQANAQFSISTGPSWVSIKALREGVQQNLNVILGGRVYPILLSCSDQNDYSVLFSLRSSSTIPGESNRPVARQKGKPISPGRLLGLLDKIKAYPTFSQVQSAMYVGMDINEPGANGKGIDETEHLRSEIKRVIRDNLLDAIGFEVEVSNKTNQMIYYNPEGFGVRVGQEVYQQTVSDAPGKIGPNAKQSIYFIIAGSADSTHHNDLSVYNDFSTIIQEVKGNG